MFKKIMTMCLVSIKLLLSTCTSAQYPKSASCENEAFDKEVNSYLSYSVPVLDVKEAFRKKEELVFLDARELNEYQISHIPNARFIGYKSFDIKKMPLQDKNQKIVVYCSIGYRSEIIATKLRKAGYKNVYNLYGSIFEWANQKHPLEDQNKKLTNNLHTYNKSWSKWSLNPDVVKKW